MADTSIAITAGSGTSVDTRTEATNGNHRQVIVIGDPSTNAGVAPVDPTAGLKVDLGTDNDVTVTSISAGDNNIGNVDIVTLPSLPAGTSNIGDVDVASLPSLPSGTNNIGDVDVASIANGSLNGPGAPTIDSYTSVAINLTTGANQVLVSSAASKQIWVYGWALTCGDANGQTVSLQDEDDTAKTGIMEFPQYGGLSVSPSGNFAMPVFKCATDKDLEVDITGGDVDGILYYAIVSV